MDATYHPPVDGVNPTPVFGNSLAHSRYSLVERAFLAADIFSGVKCLVSPTMTQAARLTGVSASYAWAAHAHRNDRDRVRIELGVRPLVPAKLV